MCPARSASRTGVRATKNAPSSRPTGRSITSNRLPIASPAGAIFFPQRPQLQLDERQYSPDFQRKITETATRAKSFDRAATISKIWSEQTIASRTVARIAEEVGHERTVTRDAEVDDFTHHRRQAEGIDPKHELVAVFVDGGRVQTRDETPGLGTGVHNERWHEDKIARLQTMTGLCHAVDPRPEPPECFRKPLLASEGEPRSPAAISPNISSEWQSFFDGKPKRTKAPVWQPKPLVRTCVGTMKPLEDFRWMVQAEAKRRHFFTAQKKAFVADGSHGNWSLWHRHFPNFVPILDFLHAAEYLHAAAKVLDAATFGYEWVRDVWRGRSGLVIAALRAAWDVRGIGYATLDEKHPLFAWQRAWTYLTNASDKLDYPRYRREGLPCTSRLIESQIEEFNARRKGSEKFWYESNAESMLQLVCATLGEDGPTLEDYFAHRPTSQLRRGDPKTPVI